MLLLMAITAVFAYFVAIESLIVVGNASETVANIRAYEGQFRAGIAGFVVITILDVAAACTARARLGRLAARSNAAPRLRQRCATGH